MNLDVPRVINDPQLKTLRYWQGIYSEFATARRAQRAAVKAYQRTRLCEQQRWRCCWCFRPMSCQPGQTDSATIEHILPRSQGGKNSWDNLATSCYRCDNLRGTMGVQEFMAVIKRCGFIANACVTDPPVEEITQEIKKVSHIHCNLQAVEQVAVSRKDIARNLKMQYKELLPSLQFKDNMRPKRMKREVDRQLALKALQEGNPNVFEPHSRAWKLYERYAQNAGDSQSHINA